MKRLKSKNLSLLILKTFKNLKNEKIKKQSIRNKPILQFLKQSQNYVDVLNIFYHAIQEKYLIKLSLLQNLRKFF